MKKPKKRGRPKRVMPELPEATMRDVWQRIFANAKPPNPALQTKTAKKR
ncbi:MAG: hypothetical protein OXG83_02975 [Acidobacteria bacterium]|nr:hypothetical protein [Acidobacteriota bacterium]